MIGDKLLKLKLKIKIHNVTTRYIIDENKNFICDITAVVLQMSLIIILLTHCSFISAVEIKLYL